MSWVIWGVKTDVQKVSRFERWPI